MESDTPRTDANVINVDYETREPDGEPVQVTEEVVLVDFARQLERDLAAAIKQRDEARREACLWALPQGVEWNEAMIARGKAIASERGWDCFAKKQGGGA